MIRKKNSIPEPIDPLFKHFHSVDIQVIKNANEPITYVIYTHIENN
jgi:E3 SUMO-protein ligase RanBP2